MQIIISDRMLIACVSFFLFLLQTNHKLAPDVEHCFLFVCLFFLIPSKNLEALN